MNIVGIIFIAIVAAAQLGCVGKTNAGAATTYSIDPGTAVLTSTSASTSPAARRGQSATTTDEARREQIASELTKFLADTNTLYFKTHAFHWNVTGRRFSELHALFGAQYDEVWNALDVIAERVRALGYPAPSNQQQLKALASLTEVDHAPPANEMIRILAEDNERMAREGRRIFSIAEGANDQATCDLLAGRIGAHEKAAWMLRSSLE